MSGVRFVEAELDYGCHAGGAAFRFEQKAEPVVIAGPNGAGKSTLLNALVRTLYGFNRRTDDDRLRLDARRPWAGGECRASVVIADADGVLWRIERRFDGSDVEIRPLDDARAEQAWSGDGNPGGRNAEAREYRRRLTARLGLAERSDYEATACVHQGELARTRLDEDLLRIAAGGHADVDEAKERVKTAYRNRTRQPLEEGGRAANKPRELEHVQERANELRQSLQHAVAAGERRGPLLREREEATERIAALEHEIEALEAAQEPLADRQTLHAKRSHADERLRHLRRARRQLDGARQAAEAARKAREALGDGLYPDDFLERLSAVETLWRQREPVDEERARAERALAGTGRPGWTRPVGAALAAAALIGGAVAAAGRIVVGLTLVVVGLAAGAAALLYRRRAKMDIGRRRRELQEADARLRALDSEVERRLEGVPDAGTLTSATAPDRRKRFERERHVVRELEEAERALAAAADAARELLTQEVRGVAAEQLLERLDDRIDAVRQDVATMRVELDQAGDAELALPDGVQPEADAVRAALRTRRIERRELARRVHELNRALVEQATGGESPVALRDRLDGLAEREAELERGATAHRRAYALLRDAYDAFRERDQERLLRRVSTHLTDLTDGALGPLEAPDSLADARVRVSGRPVALASPPLSYGELHATLLAVRLGAADFLAAAGVRPPLLVDEPFAHLDDERAAGMWTLLRTIARERQVIVATQDRAALRRLGVEPDVGLARASAGADALERDGEPPERRGVAAGGD